MRKTSFSRAPGRCGALTITSMAQQTLLRRELHLFHLLLLLLLLFTAGTTSCNEVTAHTRESVPNRREQAEISSAITAFRPTPRSLHQRGLQRHQCPTPTASHGSFHLSFLRLRGIPIIRSAVHRPTRSIDCNGHQRSNAPVRHFANGSRSVGCLRMIVPRKATRSFDELRIIKYQMMASLPLSIGSEGSLAHQLL